MNANELKTILGIITGAYPTLFDPKTSGIAWQLVLGDCEFSDVTQALKIYLSQANQYPPTPGQINQLILDSKNLLPTAGEVWGEILKLCSMSQSYTQGQEYFKDNNSALRAIRAVGWDRIRYADIENELDFLRKDFERIYKEQIPHEAKKVLISHTEAKKTLENLGLNKLLGAKING